MSKKQEILRLRSEGKSYNEIIKLIGCAKSTVSYYCGEDQKIKTDKRKSRLRQKFKLKYIFIKKIDTFIRSTKSTKQRSLSTKCSNNIFYIKIYDFLNRNKLMSIKFKAPDLSDKIEKQNNKCALSGRKLQLDNSVAWHLDHIVPIAKGGDNSLENCQVLCAEANFAKHSMLEDDFIQLCIDILQYKGYKVNKES